MKAMLCREYGPPESLVLAEHDLPTLAPKDVRVRVHSAGVNFPDVLIIQGKYQFKPAFPFAPGSEVAGEVIAVGDQVTKFRPGERVIARTGNGGFAEEAQAEESKCMFLQSAARHTRSAPCSP